MFDDEMKTAAETVATPDDLESYFAEAVGANAMSGEEILEKTDEFAARFINMAALIAKESGKLIGVAKGNFAHSQFADVSVIEDALADIEFAAQAIREQFGLPRERILCHALRKLGVVITPETLGQPNETDEPQQD